MSLKEKLNCKILLVSVKLFTLTEMRQAADEVTFLHPHLPPHRAGHRAQAVNAGSFSDHSLQGRKAYLELKALELPSKKDKVYKHGIGEETCPHQTAYQHTKADSLLLPSFPQH